jgi:hypothetical protein
MKVRASVKKICSKCKIVRRKAWCGSFAKTNGINKNKVKAGILQEEKLWHVLRA